MSDAGADFSADALRKVSEDNYAESFTCFSVVPQVDVYTGPDMIRIISPGIPNWLTNNVLRCRLTGAAADAVLDETNRYFVSRGVVPRWRLGFGDLPADLGERLVRRGFTLEEEQPAMTVDLHALPEDVRRTDGLAIDRITDAAILREKHRWISQLGGGKSLGTLLVDMWSAYGFEPDSIWQHYAAVLNGTPVANASVLYAAGVAGVYGVATAPQVRRQGIGSAITLRALLDARERGYRIGVLQSSQMGYNVYRRLGFQTCFTIKIYAPKQASS